MFGLDQKDREVLEMERASLGWAGAYRGCVMVEWNCSPQIWRGQEQDGGKAGKARERGAVFGLMP